MYGKFLVEGDKSVRELLRSKFKIDAIFALPEWRDAITESSVLRYEISEAELMQLSTHEHPNLVIAVALMPEALEVASLPSCFCVACDHINDPGNAGAIIRIADWFGAAAVVFSEGSADIYNPKAVSAAKGSLFHLPVITYDLKTFFNENAHLPIYGATLDGENIYETELPENGILLIGSEAHGIAAELQPYLRKKLLIPSFGHAESLNAAVAAGVIASEWTRRIRYGKL